METNNMRVAIVHYWLMNMRGGEKVLEALCRLLPQAEVLTLFYDPDHVSPLLQSRVVRTSFLNPLRRHYRSLLPLMPLALEHLDLRGYDLVISSESGPAKGVITRSGTHHICYCHSPMRYLWDLYPDYLHEFTKSRLRKAVFGLTSHYLRQWDYSTAARVDGFVANSENVRRRIWKTYRREATVVHPPIDVSSFFWRDPEPYYLLVSGLVAYKRIGDAIRCFRNSRRKLKVVGEGPEYGSLRRQAGPGIEFCGRVPDQDLRELYARCRAVVLPGEEDFGLVPVEAMASGKAVIALGRGGVLESVPAVNPRAGFFYDSPGAGGLECALQEFEAAEPLISPLRLQAVASRFSEPNFYQGMREVIAQSCRADPHHTDNAAHSNASMMRFR
jgi:glycosyltransferase involved in cell wall biosynthesis